MKADWLVEGGWAIFSQHHSLCLFHCLSLYFSLSLFLLSRSIPFLSLSTEGEGRRGGCKCRRKRENVLREETEWIRHARLFDNRSSLPVCHWRFVSPLTLFVRVCACMRQSVCTFCQGCHPVHLKVKVKHLKVHYAPSLGKQEAVSFSSSLTCKVRMLVCLKRETLFSPLQVT